MNGHLMMPSHITSPIAKFTVSTQQWMIGKMVTNEGKESLFIKWHWHLKMETK